MARYVICQICNKKFDIEKEQGVRVSARRYAHLACKKEGYLELIPLKTPADPDMETLKDFINKLMGDKANWSLIMRQIKKLKEEHSDYTTSGILKTLVYFYQVKKNALPKGGSPLGIVPFAYKQAYDYYYELFTISQQAENLNIPEMITKVKEIEIPPPQFQKRKKTFTILEEEAPTNE